MHLDLKVMILTMLKLDAQPFQNAPTTQIVATMKYVQHCPILCTDNVLMHAAEQLVDPMLTVSLIITT